MCSNQIKLDMNYHHGSQSAKQKEFLVYFAWEKKKFSYGNLYFFIGSRSCSNQTKLGMDYHHCSLIVKQKNFWYSLLPRKKGIFLLKFAFSSLGQGVVQIEPSSVWSINIVV